MIPPPREPGARRDRGFALLIVLLAMGLLALLATQIAAAGRNGIAASGNLGEAAALEAAAEGAIRQAAFEVFAVRDPAFRPGPAIHEVQVGGIPVLVLIENETDRVNLNTASVVLLQALALAAGAPPAEAAHVAAAIVDWRTQGALPRPNGAKRPQYAAAGVGYGPPGEPFQGVDELRFVLGVTPALFARLAPHLTVWSDGDPDLSTQDPVVAQALVDTASAAQEVEITSSGQADAELRISALAVGTGEGRMLLTEVVTSGLRGRPPRLRVLFRSQCPAPVNVRLLAACN